MLKKQVRILVAGVMLVVPLALTFWILYAIATWIGDLGESILALWWPDADFPTWLGVAVVLGLVYAAGLMARMWGFRTLFAWLDRTLGRIPGVKTIYESIRDLLNLFSGDTEKMGHVVLYRQPGTDLMLLGIMTNDNPVGIAENTSDRRVAVYQPFAYMFGGPVVYVPADHVQRIDMSVDQALKLAATAHVGAKAGPADPETPAPGDESP